MKRTFFIPVLTVLLLFPVTGSWSQMIPAQTGKASSGNGAATPVELSTSQSPTDRTQKAITQTPRRPGIDSNAMSQPAQTPVPSPDSLQAQQPVVQNPVIPEFDERSEFQNFVNQTVGRPLPIFGASLFSAPTTFAPVDRVPVPPDYVVGPGDEIMIRAWGQIDFEHRAEVDRGGMINIPRVGTLRVAGIKYENLQSFLFSAIGRNFRNFELSVSLGQLRSIQVYVVGSARRPGNYTVSSLSTLVNTLFAAGGPTANGSMRRIQLKRGNTLVTEFDLYDLVLRGDKSKDVQLLPGDVIYIPSVGPQAAIAGSVRQQRIFELKSGTTLADLIEMGGGLDTAADGRIASIERIVDRKARTVDKVELDKTGLAHQIRDGDLVQIYGLSPRFDNTVSVRGNVANPMRLPWRQGMRVRDMIPDQSFLTVPEYWTRRNQGLRAVIQDERRLAAEVKRNNDEINWDYAVIERFNARDLTTALIPFDLGKAVLDNDPTQNLVLEPSDVITIFSKSDIQVPVAKQSKYVRLEGEVMRPGVYKLEPGETLRQLVARIGGLTSNAYLNGAEFVRESARVQQQKRLDEMLDRLGQEIERNAAGTAHTATSAEDAASAKMQSEGQRRLLMRLKEAKASGRVVLNLAMSGGKVSDLPDMVLEDSDRLVVPPRSSTIGVLGSVFNQNTFIFEEGRSAADYLALAGGPTREADKERMYIVRADGSVVGGGNNSFWFRGSGGERVMAGDTIVVPENLDRFRLTKEFKDWTQIVYQFALGVVGLKVLKDL
jgi:polysaccharide export outer membrane protein